MSDEVKDEMDFSATASRLPTHSGDGYAYGGGVILTIGPRSFSMGEDDAAFNIACKIAAHWNGARGAKNA